MSPILVRPVREQLEHDRVIRLLQVKYKRKFEVAINPGQERSAPVGSGTATWYPDLVLQSTERGRKLLGVVEVETAESVNNLEAMSQWAAFARLRTAFHLYIPASSVDVARRLCLDLQIPVAEIWAYHAIGDQVRFTLVQRAASSEDGKTRAAGATPAAPAPAAHVATASGDSAPASVATRARSAATRARRPAVTSSTGRRTIAAKGKASASRRPVKAATRRTASGSSRPQKRR